jgi:hypothetical protein
MKRLYFGYINSRIKQKSCIRKIYIRISMISICFFFGCCCEHVKKYSKNYLKKNKKRNLRYTYSIIVCRYYIFHSFRYIFSINDKQIYNQEKYSKKI